MEQLGHVERRQRGRWGFRYSLQTLPAREASVKKEGMENALENLRYSDKEGVNRKCVKDEKKCQREVERREREN